MKINWELMINQKFKIVIQIYQPGNIPQKWFSTKNGPVDVRFQMRQIQTMWAFIFFRKIKQKSWNNLLKCYKNNSALLINHLLVHPMTP